MKQQRPVYLNLLKIRLPLPGLVSILHRASGIFLFLFLPFLLWLLAQSLSLETNFNQLQATVAKECVLRFFIWLVLSMLVYHLIAGIRHMIMDVGFGDSLKGGRIGAVMVLVLSAIGILLLGVWLW